MASAIRRHRFDDGDEDRRDGGGCSASIKKTNGSDLTNVGAGPMGLDRFDACRAAAFADVHLAGADDLAVAGLEVEAKRPSFVVASSYRSSSGTFACPDAMAPCAEVLGS
jgi:hypothetical protein